MFTVITTYDEGLFIYPEVYYEKVIDSLGSDYFNLGDTIVARKSVKLIEKRDLSLVEKILFVTNPSRKKELLEYIDEKRKDGYSNKRVLEKAVRKFAGVITREGLSASIKEKEKLLCLK